MSEEYKAVVDCGSDLFFVDMNYRADVITWCRKTFGTSFRMHGARSPYTFYFNRPEDRTWFLMRWS